MKEQIHKITVETPFAVGDVHTYVHIGDTVTLFDAGVNTDPAWETFQDGLKKINLIPSDIEQIVLTHNHPDHIGLLGRFPHDVRVIGHHLNRPWITHDESYFNDYIAFFNELYVKWGVPKAYQDIEQTVQGTLSITTPTELTDTIHEGDRVPGIEAMSVLETPGHAQSHLSFYHEKDQYLIGGDILIDRVSSNPFLEPPEKVGDKRPKTLLSYRESLDRVQKLNAKVIYPGHGEPIFNHKQLIEKRQLSQTERAEKVLAYVKAKHPLTPFEICTWLFKHQYKKQPGLTMSETIGQLDYLDSIGAIEWVEEAGQDYITPILSWIK